MLLQYLENQDQAAIRSMGDTMNRLAYALPQLQWQKARLEQELALDRARQILLGQQTRESQAHGGYYNALTKRLSDQATAAAGMGQGMANVYGYGVSNDVANARAGVADAIKNAAIVAQENPERAMEVMDRLSSLYGSGALTDKALMQYKTTGTRITPFPVSENQIRVAPLTGEQTVGPVVLSPGQTATLPGGATYSGAPRLWNTPAGTTTLSVGYDLAPRTGRETLGGVASNVVSPVYTNTATPPINLSTLLPSVYNSMRSTEQGPIGREAFRRAGFDVPTTSIGTNAPPAIEAVPAPAKRVVGKIYTLPKGRFIWTGNGWEPAPL